MYKVYKVRLYPNKRQEDLIRRTFGCVRFVYNQCLAYKIKKYEKNNVSISKFEMMRYLSKTLKPRYSWLNDIDKCALQNSIVNLFDAYKKFYDRYSRYPKFKSKKYCKSTYRTHCSHNSIEIDFENNKIKLPKLKWVKIRGLYGFKGKIISVTISQSIGGKFFASILVEKEDEIAFKKTGKQIGLDLGVKNYVILSNGEKIDNPKYGIKSEYKIKKLERKLSRKSSGSKNYEKALFKLTKAYEKNINQRKDFMQKLSTNLVKEYDLICVETINIRELIKNKYISKYILDCSWGSFIEMLKYKSEWYGKQLVKIDKCYPSSQICSNCGTINPAVKNLSVRKWECPNCKVRHDRDINAAINILNQGLLQIQ